MAKFTVTATQPARYSITLEANTGVEAIEIAKETNASEWEFEGYEDWEQYQLSSVQYRLENLKQE